MEQRPVRAALALAGMVTGLALVIPAVIVLQDIDAAMRRHSCLAEAFRFELAVQDQVFKQCLLQPRSAGALPRREPRRVLPF